MAFAPGSHRLFVGEQAGKIFSFPNDQACSKADLFIDMAKLTSFDPAKYKAAGNLYGLAFHPKFAENKYCYICYVFDAKNGSATTPEGSRVSRFTVTSMDPPRCDPASEKVILTWMGGGHNGGCLEFGPDGYLYISTGDGSFPNPPDALNTGQDVSDLLSSILRIDVDRPESGKGYRVPDDNPFVKLPKARPEIWSYGFRNPWKMTFDRKTGDLWVGDVGWELWEMVYRVQKGGNYGWSVMEGRQPVKPNDKRGPTPILPPTVDFPHTEAASITGGFVYRGKKYPALEGTYICGDWVTRKLWGTRMQGDKVAEHRVIAQGTQRVVAFGQDHDGELYFLHYDDNGTLHQLVPNDVSHEKIAEFPRKLSETGLFTSTPAHQPAAGVIPFAINAAQWADHAIAERFVGLPSGQNGAKRGTVVFHDDMRDMPDSVFNGKAHFPKDGVLAKTISIELERGNPASTRRLETQILHFDGNAWKGYTYRWNPEQTDAVLVDSGGAEEWLTIKDRDAPGGYRKQRWHFASRVECLTCHNPWAGYGLAFTPAQLNRSPLSLL
jgi:glucose/arabinose dehydrogenase